MNYSRDLPPPTAGYPTEINSTLVKSPPLNESRLGTEDFTPIDLGTPSTNAKDVGKPEKGGRNSNCWQICGVVKVVFGL